jgi:hypothetical protein
MNKLSPILIIAILLTACSGLLPAGPAGQPEQPVVTDPTPEEVIDLDTDPEALPMEEETEEPAAETNTPAVPTSTSLICVTLGDHPELAYTTYEEFPQAILDYLNAGASPEELAVSLILQELGPKDRPVWAEDLNGDGVREVVATVINLALQPQGAMLIFDCQDGQYVLSHTVVSSEGTFAPQLLYVQDFNNDGNHEVIYSIKNCGAHTCFEDVNILSWRNGEYTSIFEGSTLDYPYPDIKLTDFNHDGVYNMEVTGTTIASVGAGPQRNSINTWAYDQISGTWKLSEQTMAASPFRIHLMHDAEAAMDRGEYLIGGLLFQQVIEDDTYLEWANPETEYNNLAAYAYFKRIVAASFFNDQAAAKALFTELEELYAESDQYAYVEMAALFLTEAESLGLEEGCSAARQYAADNLFVILTPLGSAVYGYANPDLEPADVCP